MFVIQYGEDSDIEWDDNASDWLCIDIESKIDKRLRVISNKYIF